MTLPRWLARLLAGQPGHFHVVLALAAFSLIGYGFGISLIYRYGDVRTDTGWRATRTDERLVVTSVAPGGPAAGKLEVGDAIVAFNGDRRAATVSLWLFFGRAGSSHTLRVLRGSEEREFALSLAVLETPGQTVMAARYLVLSLSFFAMALLVGLLRPDDAVARLCSLAGFAVALRMLGEAIDDYEDFAGPTASALIWLVHPWHLVLGYQFFHRFCGNLLPERFWSVLRTALFAGGGFLFLMNQAEPASLVVGAERTIDFLYRHPAFMQLHRWVFSGPHHHFELFALLAMCAALITSYRRVTDADQRRRLRWVSFGSVAGLAPLLSVRIVGLAVDLGGRPHVRMSAGYRELLDFALMFLVVIPVALGYAVVKHRVLGIQVVIRSSVKYLLARNVLQAVLLLPALGLVLPIFRNPNRSLAELFLENAGPINLVLLLAISLSLKYRKRLRSWIDRKFFREAYNQEIVLRELIEKIRELDSIVEISRLVSSEVDAALHPRRLHVFCREQERSDLILGYSSGGATEQRRVPDDFEILKLMEAHGKPQDVPPPRNWVLPEVEQEWLANLDAHLIVPISSTSGRVAGLLLLGEKKSEEPYTPTDRKLLQTVANQMGVVCEKVWLKDQIDEEQRIRRHVLAHLDRAEVNLVKECPACGACFDSIAERCSGDDTALTLVLPVERTVEGKYRLERRIGKGGMGAVYEATDVRLHRKVAVKVLVGSLFGNRAALRRFQREAQAAAKLSHPNIVCIHDFGTIGREGAYLVMERLYGSSWRVELERRGSIPTAVAAGWFDQLLGGLKAAHDSGVVHRDLKPENVLVVRGDGGGDLVKILDFGLAKTRLVEGTQGASVTVPGTIIGTIDYMAPEQLSGRESDERSDLFAVGVMALEAITGTHPFRERGYPERATAAREVKVVLPGEGAAVSNLAAVLEKSLALEPSSRFQTVAEMQAALIGALATCPQLTPSVPETTFSAPTISGVVKPS